MKISTSSSLERENLLSQLSLTERQEELLSLLAEGKSNKEIAFELEITEGTVKQHLFTLFKKLGVTNRTKAVLKADELIKSRSGQPAKHSRHSEGAKAPLELPNDYAWRMFTAVAIAPKPPQTKSTTQLAKFDQLLHRLRAEAESLADVLDGQLMMLPGGIMLVGFGAPKSHLDDAARAVFFARKTAQWMQTQLPAGIGIATAATLVGFSREPLYQSKAFDLAQDLANRAEAGKILATDITCKTAGPTFPYKNFGPREEAAKFVVKEIPVNQDADLAQLTRRTPLPYMQEIDSNARRRETQWIGIEGWPPSACMQLTDIISAHTETLKFHTYRLRLCTSSDAEEVGANLFAQLKLIARLRERSDGNEPFVNVKTNVMSAVTALKVLCMRGPTAIFVYGVSSLEVMREAFGEKGLSEISRLPLIVVATTHAADTQPHVTVKLFGSLPNQSQKVSQYRLSLNKAPQVPDGVNADLVTMIDILSPPARQALRTFVQSGKKGMITGEKEIGLMVGKELLICGLFTLNGNVIQYRDTATEEALGRFFAHSIPAQNLN